MFSYFEWLLVAFPLLGMLTNGLLGGRFSNRVRNAVACGAVLCSILVAMPLLAGQVMAPGLVGRPHSIPWIRVWSGERYVEGPIALRVDALSALVAFVVLSVELSIHVYLAHSLTRANGHLVMSALNGTLAALMLFVLGDNMPTLFLGWALAGWSSYWLAQHQVPRSVASPAMANARRGDSGKLGGPILHLPMALFHLVSDILLLLAIGLMSNSFASLNLEDITALKPLSVAEGLVPARLSGTVICLVASAVMRAGQFPFHAWLVRRESDDTQEAAVWAADAQIYALTSVPAGVYLLARLLPVVKSAAFGLSLLAWCGAISALLMALSAWIQPDARRVLRYAAVSQGGALLAALGVGAYTAALCYLLAYLLLQALIFLAASDAIWVASDGGPARAKVPEHLVTNQATGTAIALGLVAATGIPTLPGFAFARHLLAAALHQDKGIWGLTMLTLPIVAASATRATMVFAKQARISGSDSLPISSRTVLSALAFFAIVIGLLGLFSPSPLERFLGSAREGTAVGQSSYDPSTWWSLAIPPALTIAGAALAYWREGQTKKPGTRIRLWIASGYAAPSFYRSFVARPVLAAARFVADRVEAEAARWTVDRIAQFLDRSDEKASGTSTQGESSHSPGFSVLPYVLGVMLVLAFLLITLFSRTR